MNDKEQQGLMSKEAYLKEGAIHFATPEFMPNISLFISVLLFITLFDISITGDSLTRLIHLTNCVICLVYCINNKNFLSGFRKRVAALLFLFLTEMIISTALFGEDGYVKAAAVQAFIIITFFLTAECLSKINIQNLFRGALYVSGVLILINDILMIVWPAKFYGQNDDFYIGTFLLGNKFKVGYAHLFFLIFLAFSLKADYYFHLKMAAASLVLVAVCIYVKCSTIALGGLYLFLIMLLYPWIKRVVISKFWMVLLYSSSAAFPVLYTAVVNVSAVKFVIVDVLHRNITLTGRTNVYPVIGETVKESPLFGHGFESTIITEKTFDGWHGYSNVQNGFLDIVINYGVIGAILFTALVAFLIFIAIRKNTDRKLHAINIALLALQVLMIIGTVEISYRYQFFVFLALLGTATNTFENDRSLHK